MTRTDRKVILWVGAWCLLVTAIGIWRPHARGALGWLVMVAGGWVIGGCIATREARRRRKDEDHDQQSLP